MLNLRDLRKSINATQDDVASALNITRAAYSNIETGRRDPSTDTLIRLSLFFGVSVDVILGLDPAPVSHTNQLIQNIFDQLNATGQELLIDYAEMLVSKPMYRLEDSAEGAV